jgi:hypothetical protein
MKRITIRARSVDNLLVGAFLIAVAVVGLLASWHLRPGEVSAMGPGYIPRLLLFLQAGLGIAIFVQGFIVSTNHPEGWSTLEGWSPRAIFWILAAIAFFTATLRPYGLIVATLGLCALAGFANRDSRLVEVAVSMVVLTVMSVGIFVYALGLTIPVWLDND